MVVSIYLIGCCQRDSKMIWESSGECEHLREAHEVIRRSVTWDFKVALKLLLSLPDSESLVPC